MVTAICMGAEGAARDTRNLVDCREVVQRSLTCDDAVMRARVPRGESAGMGKQPVSVCA